MPSLPIPAAMPARPGVIFHIFARSLCWHLAALIMGAYYAILPAAEPLPVEPPAPTPPTTPAPDQPDARPPSANPEPRADDPGFPFHLKDTPLPEGYTYGEINLSDLRPDMREHLARTGRFHELFTGDRLDILTFRGSLWVPQLFAQDIRFAGRHAPDHRPAAHSARFVAVDYLATQITADSGPLGPANWIGYSNLHLEQHPAPGRRQLLDWHTLHGSWFLFHGFTDTRTSFHVLLASIGLAADSLQWIESGAPTRDRQGLRALVSFFRGHSHEPFVPVTSEDQWTLVDGIDTGVFLSAGVLGGEFYSVTAAELTLSLGLRRGYGPSELALQLHSGFVDLQTPRPGATRIAAGWIVQPTLVWIVYL